MTGYRKLALASLLSLHSCHAASISETWDESFRLSPGYWEHNSYETNTLFGRSTDNVLAFKAATSAPIQELVLYLNDDNDESTGYMRRGPLSPTGFERYIILEIKDDAQVLSGSIFTGCPPLEAKATPACRKLVKTLSIFSSESGQSVEFEIPKERVNEPGVSAVISTLKSITFMPASLKYYYQVLGASILSPSTSQCSDTRHASGLRAAIVYSSLEESLYFSPMGYAQLHLAVQSHCLQAGIPFDTIRVDDVLNVEMICSKYTVVIFPYAAHVRSVGDRSRLMEALMLLTQLHGVSLITSGNFLTNLGNKSAATGAPYQGMVQVLGLRDAFPVYHSGLRSLSVHVGRDTFLFEDVGVPGSIVAPNSPDQLGLSTNTYVVPKSSSFLSRIAADQVLKHSGGSRDKRPAIYVNQIKNNIFGKTSAPVVHFATPGMLVGTSAGWRAIQYTTTGACVNGKPENCMRLRLSRQVGLQVTRVDMDQSMYDRQRPILHPALYSTVVQPWIERYNFAATYFINIGNPKKGRSKYTDWNEARTLYGLYAANGSEIGSHSRNHPHDINKLSNKELKWQFGEANKIIKRELSLDRIGAAQPGMPEQLRVARNIAQYFQETYWSLGYSPYPAVGFIAKQTLQGRINLDGTAAHSRLNEAMNENGLLHSPIYIAPNMDFDFTLAQFKRLTPAQAAERWRSQFSSITHLARCPIIVYPIHDYGPVDWNPDTKRLHDRGFYNLEMFEETIQMAYEYGVEFITAMALADRVRAVKMVSIRSELEAPAVLRVTIKPLAHSDLGVTLTHGRNAIGGLAITVGSPVLGKASRIWQVEKWPAFNEDAIYLPRGGGTFIVHLAQDEEQKLKAPDTQYPRIHQLPMRAELINASIATNSNFGDALSHGLKFELYGQGTVTTIFPKCRNINFTGSSTLNVTLDNSNGAYTVASFHFAHGPQRHKGVGYPTH